MEPGRKAVVAGIGRTVFSRNSGRTTLGMAVGACRDALADAGLPASKVGGVICFHTGDSSNTLEVGYGLGLAGTSLNLDIYAGGNAAAIVVAQAAQNIQAGVCDAILVYRSLNSRSGKRYGTIEGNVEIGGAAQFGAPHGYLVPGQWFAMWARRHMHEYGTTEEDLGHVAITYRNHAARNPHAIMRDPMTMEQYLASRKVYEPFKVPDCSLEADGAVAVLLTSAELARDLKQKPIQILGHESYMGSGGYPEQWPEMTRMYSSVVGPRLWDRTGLKPADMDVACLYDCFTYTGLCTTEDYGFCEKGEGGQFYASGRGTYGGDVVINPHGGLLSEGYIHGMNHHYEAVLQLRGQAGDRQVDDVELCLVSAGGITYGSALVYAPL